MEPHRQLASNQGNNQYRFNLLVDYCNEEHTLGVDDEGNKIIKLGVEFIDDIDLLKEMRDWQEGGNFDRITAFSHALVYARELDKRNIQPEKKEKKQEGYTKKEILERQRMLGKNPLGRRRFPKY